VKNTSIAIMCLHVARELSQDKTWNASRITGRKEESIFRECNVLLYKASLMNAQEVISDEPQAILEMCIDALNRATDSTFPFY